jgi:hypothetical protein
MVQTCSKCSRANPGDAIYCYFDGFVLAGHGQRGGPVAVGAQTFANPFVLPSGRQCRSFNELALACQEEWAAAGDMLKEGYLESFLSGLGRVDLALVAREAARFPDRDRGLDQLLAKLPSDALDEPKLRVEPQAIHLGVIEVGTSRKLDLHLENQGMRLLYGSVTCADNVWLAIGEADQHKKIFQFTHEQTIPIHVRPDRLRAGNKPLAAHLLVESNAGTAEVVVRAEVPVKPFPNGVLAGAKSPRQVAEKAKAHPKDAAPLFESGAVAEWYRSNGWTYPVQGPSASGIGAVQQFFEALGLTPPPKVEISERSITLTGNAGEQLQHTLEVRALEKRPVYAHARSSQPWLEVSRAKLNGRVATINVSVPSVPDRPGETLTAKLVVQSNGNQRFVVPVTLQVAGFNFGPTPAVAAAVPAAPVPPPVAAAVDDSPFAPAAVPSPGTRSGQRFRRSRGAPWWQHAVPAALLLLILGGIMAYDAFHSRGRTDGPGPEKGRIGYTFGDLRDTDPFLRVNYNAESHSRFGLLLTRERDPENRDRAKRLTYEDNGKSNNTCVKIDGDTGSLFGLAPAKVLSSREDKEHHAWEVVCAFLHDIQVTQTVQIVPGDQSGVLDTCLIRYTVVNKAQVMRKVGLRVMFDTYIGANDGVPFVIPKQKGLLDRAKVFDQKQIPDYLEALEKPNLKNPGTVAHMGLKGIKLPDCTPEPITKMIICTWPGNSEVRYDDVAPGLDTERGREEAAKETIKDSCVALFWAYREMDPGEVRDMVFSYGLGSVSTPEGSGNLALTAGGSFVVGNDFTVTALVKNAENGQKVKLTLPDGLELASGEEAEKTVESIGDTKVSWTVHSARVDNYTLSAESAGSKTQYRLKITSASLFK